MVKLDKGRRRALIEIHPEFALEAAIQTSPEIDILKNQKVSVSIRPEYIVMSEGRMEERTNVFQGEILKRAFLGNFYDYRVRVGREVLQVQASHSQRIEVGGRVSVFMDPKLCVLLKG
ncbi:TOBE domain-containing protein [Candidatus Aerophobetes bacterium]|uniref:TOBE domain-containing protein n=1 Tax=Aerophobetes bacterium TaxID=2030807 RepID=A0A523W4T3_UNCAE|nr:MAG: TOBE domain-containing protein [Candidatus Aerophobetes bacterium]